MQIINLVKIAAAAFIMTILSSGLVLAASVDRIIAVVNGDIITMRQLDRRVDSLAKTQKGVNREEMRRKVLDALVEQELVSQTAKGKGIFVTDGDVNQAIEGIKRENNLNDAQFKASLGKSGLDYESFRDDLRFEILKNRVLGAVVMSKVVVTDNEVTAFLNGEGPAVGGGGSFVSGFSGSGNANMGVRLIAIPCDPKTKSKALAEAKRIKGEIEKGLSFAEAAGLYSRGPGADNGGDPGDLTVGQLQPLLRDAVSNLKPGQVSAPVDVDNAYLLLTVADNGGPAPSGSGSSSKGGKGDDFSPEARKAARAQLENYKMQQRYQEWITQLKSKAIIKITL